MLKTILNRPVAVVTVFTVIVIVSLIMALGIPLEMYPNTDVPILVVVVTYPGAGPEEVEEEIALSLEGEMSGLEGLDIMTTYSYENYASVLLEFKFGSDMTELQADVRSRIDRVKANLPDQAEEPQLYKYDPSSMPIMTLVLNGDRSERELARIAEDQIIPSLEALEGVAGVDLEGIRESIVRVDIDQLALESYGLSMTTVGQILSAQNLQLGAGSFEEADKDIIIRTSGRYANLDEIGDTVIMTVPDSDGEGSIPIRLKDMGTVSWGYADAESLVRINGEKGITLNVRKSSGANSVQAADLVKSELESLNGDLPGGVSIALLTDSTEDVRTNLFEVGKAAVLGVLFAVIVLLVFLRQVKSTVIVGLSIPIALLITVAGLAITGRTLNIVTLVGLSMGVGLIVDSSIVIIENIYRLRQKGAPMEVAARRGAGEMMAPIVASTLTTVAVFLPLVLYKNDLGFLGGFFGELAFVVILALLSSLAIAAILVPVLSSRFLTIHTRAEKPIGNRFLRGIDDAMERGLTSMENAFAGFLKKAMKHKGLIIAVALGLLGGSVFLFTRINVSMMPDMPETSIYLEADFPTGTAIGETERILMDLQKRIADEAVGTDRIVVTAEKSEGTVEVTFSEDTDAAETARLKAAIRTFIDDYPGVEFVFSSNDMAAQAWASSGVDVAVTGSDWDAIMDLADKISMTLSTLDGIEEVENDAERGLPEAEIIFDRKALYAHGLNAASVAAEVRALTAGTTSTTYIEDGETYDVVLRLAESDRSKETDLERLFVTNASGERVSLAQIAEIRRSSGPTTITREDQIRTVHVVGTPADGAAIRDITDAAEALLSESIEEVPGAHWSIGGEMDEFAETGSTMVFVMIIAALLVVAVMVAQFESFKDPLLIFMAMPMMIIGIAVVFAVSGTTLSMISMMGIIMLLGIVVNNGIVLVDHTRLLRRRGMGVEQAAVESGRSRLKPVLMTTLTTILAMTPMAFFPGEGGAMMQPMGLAIVGGLTTSTLGTLVLVPILYVIFHRREKDDFTGRRERRRAKKAAEADPAHGFGSEAFLSAEGSVFGANQKESE